MITEINIVKDFLIGKFGKVENVKNGTYAIPKETLRGDAFMRVIISDGGKISGMRLFWDEELTLSWYDFNKDGSKL